MIINIAIVLLSAYLIFGIVLYLTQRSFIYFPKEKVTQPYPEMVFTNENESIKVIVTNEGQEKALLYFGGNAEAVGLSSERIAKEFPDYTTYLVNYRGYGGSTGKPTEAGLYSDALFIYDQISKKHTVVNAAGRSLGSSVAAYLASKRKIEKLALITPFDSVEHIAQVRFPLYPMSLLLKDKYDSIKSMEHSTVEKTLILIAENDKLVKEEFTQKLVHSLPFMKVKVVTISGVEHSNVSSNERYYEILRNFFGKMRE